jgi:hypothetical protein
MRNFITLIIVTILIGVAIVPVSAQPSSYESMVAVTNVADTAGTITLTFYDPDGSEAGSQTESIQSLETLYFETFSVASGFEGSMVISSSVPLASSSTLIGSDVSIMNYASYVGVSQGASKVFIPLLMDENYGYNTYFSVQNAGTTDVNVAITYSDGLTANITGLGPGSAEIIDNQNEAHTEKKFSAILEATGPIAVVVVEWSDGTYGDELLSYNGFAEEQGSTELVFPLVNQNNYGYWTAIPIRNLGDTDTDVTLTYVPTKAGTECSEILTVPANGYAEFGNQAFVFGGSSSTTCVLGERFIGSAVVTANSTSQPLVGVMNQSTTIQDGLIKGSALMTMDPSLATAKIVFPESYQGLGSEEWWSSITIVNVSGATLQIGDVTCHGIGTAEGTPVDETWSNTEAIDDGEGWITDLFWKIDTEHPTEYPLQFGFMGGIICESASGGEIVGLNNNLGHLSGDTIDSLTSYEGINVAP